MSVLAACGGAKQSGGESKPAAPAAPASGGEAKSSGDGSLDKIKSAGVLRVGVDTTYPPMEFIDSDGKSIVGFDIDYAKALAQKLGVKAEFQSVAWEGILTGLTSGRYDVIISSMNITDERKQQVNFVEYVQMSQVFVSREGVEVKTDADLSGKIVAVQAETTSHIMVDELKKNKIKDIKEIRSFPNGTDTFIELKNKRADVVVIDEPVGRYYAKKDGLKVTGQAAKPEPVGIAIRKSDVDLMKAIEKAVADLKADGTLKKLSENWFGGELGK
jgi:polar amino acid transport system substrate-binding protein